MEGYIDKIKEAVFIYLIFGCMPLFLLVPIARHKIRLKLLGAVFFFGLLEGFLFYLRGLNVDDISASAQTFSCASGMTILFVPVIFFLLILLSWAENRRQALCIALSYFLVGVSLGEINIESNIVAILGIIVCGSLFGILMRLIEKDKRRLALLVTVMILVYIYISNMTSKLFPMLFIEGILSLAITVMLLKLLTKLCNTQMKMS